VLTVLVFAEHSMGVWGLLLAVPITVFALDYCIRCAAASVAESAWRVRHSCAWSGRGLEAAVTRAVFCASVRAEWRALGRLCAPSLSESPW